MDENNSNKILISLMSKNIIIDHLLGLIKMLRIRRIDTKTEITSIIKIIIS